MSHLKFLVFTLILFVGSQPALATQEIQLIQESDFRYMYTPQQQNRLLYEAEQIVEDTLLSIGCADVSAKGIVTEEAVEVSFINRLLGEKSKSARFKFEINAACPASIEALEAFVSFSFHRSDIDTVFYYAFVNSESNEFISSVIVDSWYSLPAEDKNFKGYIHCTEEWVDSKGKYELLSAAFCQ